MPDTFDIDAVIELERALRRQDPSPTDGAERVGKLVDIIRDAGVHVTSENAVSLDREEQAAMDHLIAVRQTLLHDWRFANQVELTAAHHVLQSAIVQHMLHRLNPEAWIDWRLQDPD